MPDHVLRDPEAHRHVEDLLGQLDQAVHLRAAAGQHHAARDQVLEAAAAQLVVQQGQQLLVARLDHLGQGLAREPPRRTIADARHLDGLAVGGQLRQGAGVLDLDQLGVLGRRAQATAMSLVT
jgi:hypothetical protein